ncbi:transglycosylase SLT domain-containing protein [Streptomyces hesseae]|uniref:Transglycosylase SLT domain-containing protein n=1 Tax=Streptomyces hesseae TaxID=3075519 RepID=A0ABU2SIF5_9ACTN|nr:transglycosylase SLT domain-containing protein [Streptomyces sp. DSM 40473]MDT0447555.1 transglycosylase SLT domain-containing protein [Streptomyces sp. DSM 40473]
MRSTISGYTALPKAHKISATAVLVAAGAAVALAAVPATAAETTGVKTVAQSANEFGVTQQAELDKATDAATAQATTTATAKKAEAKKADDERASRSTERTALKPATKPAKAAPAAKAYGDNLDGWIKQSLDILSSKGIPASYDGIKRNVMRESTGNPHAINDWDVNAVNGVPSKGLLQIIDPTFKAYHVEGTSWDIYDPVANITASCAYAADKYGSMDNVNSAY